VRKTKRNQIAIDILDDIGSESLEFFLDDLNLLRIGEQSYRYRPEWVLLHTANGAQRQVFSVEVRPLDDIDNALKECTEVTDVYTPGL
jgi:hypothetical protein